MISLDLIAGSEGVNVGVLGPGERNHATGAVELHSAATKGNHGMSETEIFGG